MMTKLETVDRLVLYYQGFHHTCVTWYITVMGFFVAGLIASSGRLNDSMLVAVLVMCSALGVAFFMCIFHYGARIACLYGYLSLTEEKIPANWHALHRKQTFAVKGAGSIFFLALLVIMQLAVWWLALSV